MIGVISPAVCVCGHWCFMCTIRMTLSYANRTNWLALPTQWVCLKVSVAPATCDNNSGSSNYYSCACHWCVDRANKQTDGVENVERNKNIRTKSRIWALWTDGPWNRFSPVAAYYIIYSYIHIQCLNYVTIDATAQRAHSHIRIPLDICGIGLYCTFGCKLGLI